MGAAQAREAADAPSRRLGSLDSYRGAMMLLLVAGPTFGGLAARWNLHAIAAHFRHAQWQGCTLWDLIMPSFMLMVGVSIPFSYAPPGVVSSGRTP